jgi:hypothetical protein
VAERCNFLVMGVRVDGMGILMELFCPEGKLPFLALLR